MHRVFPSCCLINFASARRIQFHQVKIRDSGAVVIPFMQVGTYPTRDFATLEPSELQLPFIGTYILSLNKNLNKRSFILQHRAGLRPYTSSFDFAESCVFNKQSPLHFQYHLTTLFLSIVKHPLSRSYRVILPSSFNFIILPSNHTMKSHQSRI